MGMVVDSDQRKRMAALARSLAAVETDEPQSGVALERAIERANVDRAARGLPPLAPDSIPEEEFYLRARALGLSRIRG
jgi:hypothetical protein